MSSINHFYLLVVGTHLFFLSFSFGKPFSLSRNAGDTVFSSPQEALSNQERYKRDRESDLRDFHWSFSVESPSIQIDPPSTFSTSRQSQSPQNNGMPEISVQFFDGFKSFGAPGEQASRIELEERNREEGRRAEGWDGSRSVFVGPTRSCCGPNYPFRTCCQT